MDEIEKIAKRIYERIINASPAIWNTPPYKVTVYPDEAEGNHKERHVAVNVKKDTETGTISIKDGKVLAGNLSSNSIKWCVNTLLTEENKQRINIMIENKDFYRLDRIIEVKAHPLPDNMIIAYKFPSWEDKLIENVEYLGDCDFKITFRNKTVKVINIESYINKHKKIFKDLIEHNISLDEFKFDSIEIYWNDLMGIEAQTLYDLIDN